MRLAVVLLLALSVRAAYADPGFSIGPRPAWYVLGGVTAGDTLVGKDGAGFVGGELSVARLHRGIWLGAYGDGYRDFGSDGTYATAGLEAGWRFIGADAGGALRFDHGDTHAGATGRVYLGVGVLAFYVRYAYFPDAMVGEHVLQIGGELKFPLFSPHGGGR